MTHRLTSYLWPFRNGWDLSQDELARLLGYRSASTISRVEKEERDPTLAVLLGCQVVFGTKPEELFPGLFGSVESAILKQANELYDELQGNRSRKTASKLDLLEDLFERAKRRALTDL